MMMIRGTIFLSILIVVCSGITEDRQSNFTNNNNKSDKVIFLRAKQEAGGGNFARRRSAGSSPLSSYSVADWTAPLTLDGVSYNVILDTGSGDFALASNSPLISSLGVSPLYPLSSQNCNLNQQFQYTYLLGSWQGVVCQGTVQFSGATSSGINFAAIVNQSQFFTGPNINSNQGIIGLAFPGSNIATSPLLQQLYTNNAISRLLFSLQLCRSNSGTSHGWITLGGIASDLHYGEIQYLPLNSQASIYEAAVFAVGYGSQGASFAAQGGLGAIIDSGTNEILLPKSVFDGFLTDLVYFTNLNWNLQPIQCLSSPLTAAPNLTFTMSTGLVLSIAPFQYVRINYDESCGAGQGFAAQLMVGIATKQSSQQQDYFLLGTPLFAAYYTVFDQDQNAVGFAPIAGCNDDATPPPSIGDDGGSNFSPSSPLGITLIVAGSVIVVSIFVLGFSFSRSRRRQSDALEMLAVSPQHV